jgi:hypothetical protein
MQRMPKIYREEVRERENFYNIHFTLSDDYISNVHYYYLYRRVFKQNFDSLAHT